MVSDAIHILWSRVDRWSLSKMPCPTCKKKRYFWSWFQDWYGWESTCLKCGDRWQDGERCERPFRPRWRKESVKSALLHARHTIRESRREDHGEGEG